MITSKDQSEVYGQSEVAGGVTVAAGFVAAGIHTGVKRQKKDLSLLFSKEPCSAAATFTTNRVKAAPLIVTEEHIGTGVAHAVVVNSGNANACNGARGFQDARSMADRTAAALEIQPEQVLVASTGVIGEPLSMEKILPGIATCAELLSPEGGQDAALGIMTTDTVPKEYALRCRTDGGEFTIGGMAKGSGMIHPNMATMLAFLTTDAHVEPAFLQERLRRSVDKSFNMISVDGDTSTNDMVIVLANGESGVRVARGSKEAEPFGQALDRVCVNLAQMIARDGEGATKLIEVHVRGAKNEKDARLAARAITRSPLVKTAVYGEDANWGRILCAAGYSGADFDPDDVRVTLGEITVFDRGVGMAFDEGEAKTVLAEKDVRIQVDLGAGDADATGWTCDLTYDYVKINASYRT